MDLFKNGVGRPSNETLKKRRNVKGVMALFVIAIIGISGYYMYNTFSVKSVESGNKNTQTATAVAEIHATGNKNFYDIDKSNQSIGYFNVYGTGSFTFNIDYYKVISNKMYYKIFTYESGNYNKKAKVYKTCTLLSGKSNGLSKPLKTQKVTLKFTNTSQTRAIKTRIYSSLSQCNADTTSTKKATYGQTVAIVNSKVLGDVASTLKISIKDLYAYSNKNQEINLILYKLQDINGNGKVDDADKNLIKAFSAGYGDVNMNYELNDEDVNLILKYSVNSIKPNAAQKKLADLNLDGKITPEDARILSRALSEYGYAWYADTSKVDGKIDDADRIVLDKIIDGFITPTDSQKDAADVNRDGIVNAVDLEMLK